MPSASPCGGDRILPLSPSDPDRRRGTVTASWRPHREAVTAHLMETEHDLETLRQP